MRVIDKRCLRQRMRLLELQNLAESRVKCNFMKDWTIREGEDRRCGRAAQER